MPEMGRLLPISQILYKNYMYFREWGNYGHTPDTWPWTCDWSVYFSVRPTADLQILRKQRPEGRLINVELPVRSFSLAIKA